MYKNKIEELIEKKDFKQAKECILKDKEISQDIEMLKYLGLCNINLGEYNEALENFKVVDGKIVLQGVADSSAIVEKAIVLAQKEEPDYKIESTISVVQDFKARF